ncbi:MAG: GNAT family N-acetyltransferase [Candidatus Yanofskybacteria bacterium]|nr:GNAT family N-acetyltransferase [Candidatus Yanofskybacteria bacterium]
MDFKFTNEYSMGRLDEAVSFLLGPRLWIPSNDYPDFLDWAQKTHGELKSNAKRAIIALSWNDIVGVVIYQRHKKDKSYLEIKNLTVRPDARGRYIASFLLRNAEVEGMKEFSPQFITCDAKAKNLEIMHFLLKHHYKIYGKHDLYGLSSGEDLVYKKRVINLIK